jgi:hypothetical protein
MDDVLIVDVLSARDGSSTISNHLASCSFFLGRAVVDAMNTDWY